MGLFSSKKKHTAPTPAETTEISVKSALSPEKESIYEAMVQDLLRESKTSMGIMGKSSTKAAVQMLLPNERPIYAILTNVSLGEVQSGDEFQSKGIKNKSNGVIIITDERLLFAGALGTPVSKAMDLAKITVIDDSNVSSVMHSVLRVETADTIMAIDGNKQVLSAFYGVLKHSVRKRKRQT